MQSNLKVALKVMGMALFASLLCLFVQVSIHTMMKSFTTEPVGYEVHEVKDDGSSVDHGIISVEDAPETPEENFRYMAIYPDIPQSAKVVETVISLIFSLGILFCTTGSVFAGVAAKDRNDCDYNGAVPNKNRGLIIGAIAAIPPALGYIAALVLRFIGSGKAVDWYYWVYRFIIMGPVKPLTDILTATPTGSFVIGDKTYITTGAETSLLEVPVWTVAVMGVCILLFVLMGYLMYRICYNEDSMLAKLLYKSTRKEEIGRRLGGR